MILLFERLSGAQLNTQNKIVYRWKKAQSRFNVCQYATEAHVQEVGNYNCMVVKDRVKNKSGKYAQDTVMEQGDCMNVM